MTHDQAKTQSDFKVGLLTLLAVCILAAGITLAGGDKGLLFQKTSLVRARLSNIGGLKKGAAVTMGGMMIGKVQDISFSGNTVPNCIELKLAISEKMRRQIKADSIPVIKTQGMLGDRYIEISTGDPAAPPLAGDGVLTGKSASDFDEALQNANTTLSETSKLLGAINDQKGTVGQLLYDKEFYSRITEIEAEVHELIKDFKKQPRKYIKFSVF